MFFAITPRAEVDAAVEQLLSHTGGFAEVISTEIDASAAAVRSAYEIAGARFVREVILRLTRAEFRQQPFVGSSGKLVDYSQTQVAGSKVEGFHILFLDHENALIKDDWRLKRMINQTPVYTHKVIKSALEFGASALILLHNQSSGDQARSAADIVVSNHIIETAAREIAVHDHLIPGATPISFGIRGLISFTHKRGHMARSQC
jgi:DNA repair protein RadC